MSKISLTPNAAGTGTFNIAAPGTNTNRTLTLPDSSGTVVLDTAAQTLTNKTIQGGAITSATAVTASGTAVDFTGIPSWVKRITVMFSGVSTNGTSLLLIQLGDAGGVETADYTSYSYGGAFASSNIAGTSNTNGFLIMRSVTAASLMFGQMVFTKIDGTTWVGAGTTNSSTYSASNAGAKTLSDTLTQVRITTVNGTDTFDAGTINIMYEG
jgi:hypothetical protein